MKKIIFGLVGIFCAISAHAVDLTLVSYDGNMYSVIDPAYAAAGQLTQISDIYYYYKPFEHSLVLTQTEWLGDGNGYEYQAPYSPSEFYYSGITFENFDKEIGLEGDEFVLQNVADLKNQFDNWVANNVSELTDLSVIGISRNIVKQHNIDIYNSVFGNIGFNDDKFSVWGTTLLNSMNKSGKYNYSTNGLGVILGADLQLSDSVLMGAGYSYSNVDIDINPSDILFDTGSVFLYSKWQPSKFYVNGLVAYNFADYEYIDSELNNGDVSGLFASVMAGYKTEYGLSPEIGIRYTNIELNQNSEYLKKSKSDFYSVVAGAGYEHAIGDFVLGGRAFVEYNITQPDNKVDLDVLGYKYNFEIEDTERPLGAEFGIWAEYNISGINLRLNYDLRLHTDVVNHTGGLSLRYVF
ncbi:MAG: autotransporter outer membrane beta-barrel domain-containing protein [Alphaproteobacteria bacterium]|nr:autotransporter outer membrane beta-barrel domain-containing protein [Alphaproteobacteria bacterium]